MSVASKNGKATEGHTGEFVVCSLSALEGFSSEPSPGQLRRTYELIQEAKRIRKKRQGLPADSPDEDSRELTIREARDELIMKRVQNMRPDSKWTEIAGSLGCSRKTLCTHRTRLFDKGHPHHPA